MYGCGRRGLILGLFHENIIQFKLVFFWIQIDDADYARQLGLRDPPTLVHFSGGVPSIYYGDEKKDPILAWLIHLKEEAVIEVITEEILVDLIEEEEYVMVFFR